MFSEIRFELFLYEIETDILLLNLGMGKAPMLESDVRVPSASFGDVSHQN